MTLVTVTSAKGSPGATTLALNLARELVRRGDGGSRVFLVDADAGGGDLALWLGLEAVPGAATLALTARHGLDQAMLLAHSQQSPAAPGVAILAGVAGRAQRPSLDWLAGPLSELATTDDLWMVADGGRLEAMTGTRELVDGADRVLLACRPETASVVHARSALSSLTSEGIEAQAVVIGAPAETADELAAVLGHVVAAVIPLDEASSTPNAARPAARFQVAGLRPAGRRADTAMRSLAAFVALEAPPLALPLAQRLEIAPDEVAAAAARVHGLGVQA